jgi:hypothetical protein
MAEELGMLNVTDFSEVMARLENEATTFANGCPLPSDWPHYPAQGAVVESFQDFYYDFRSVRHGFQNWRLIGDRFFDDWSTPFYFGSWQAIGTALSLWGGRAEHPFDRYENVDFHPFGTSEHFPDRVRFRPGRFDGALWLTRRDSLMELVEGMAVNFYDNAITPFVNGPGYFFPLMDNPTGHGKVPTQGGGDWVGTWWNAQMTQLHKNAADAYAELLADVTPQARVTAMRALWRPFGPGSQLLFRGP